MGRRGKKIRHVVPETHHLICKGTGFCKVVIDDVELVISALIRLPLGFVPGPAICLVAPIWKVSRVGV